MVSNPQHEPTMEEILASIRKIISEDSSEAPQPAAPEPVKAAAQPEPDGDVLELTQAIEETPEPAPKPEPEEDDVVFQSIEEAAVSIAPAEAPQNEGIFSDKTRKAMDETFANIEPPATPAKPREAAAPLPPLNGASLESLLDRAVRETFDPVLTKWLGDNSGAIIDRMKPVIREWLDEHFPELLEEAVRTEVARVVKARKR
jgi:uncharacterized protein